MDNPLCNMQYVTVSRFWDSAAAFRLSPGMTEVTIFGGCPEFPGKYRNDADLSQITNTTVLRFGEYTSCVCILRKGAILCN